MSETESQLRAGLALMGSVMKEIVNESQEIMKIHPVNSLIMLDLYSNIGYALLTSPDERGNFTFGGITFATRQDMIADVFRMVGHKVEDLLTVEAVSQIFSFKLDLGKVAAALGGTP